jgi:uncharacterized membrane protein
LVVLAISLRSHHLSLPLASRDECFSWRLIQYPVSEQIHRTAADVHPPLHYLVLSAWAQCGGISMTSLRTLSVALGVATIPALWLALAESARDRIGTRIEIHNVSALVSVGLLAIHTRHIDASRNARMYSLGVLLATIAAWALLKAVRRGGSHRREWIIYTVTMIAFCYTHYFAFFTLAAHGCFFMGLLAQRLFMRRTGDIRPMIAGFTLAMLGLGLAYAPWVHCLAQQVREVRADYWIPMPTWVELRHAVGLWAIGLEAASNWEFWLVILLVACISLLALYQSPRMALFWFTQASVPWILCLSISWITERPIFQERYLVFAHVGFLGLLATALAGPALFYVRLLIAWWIISLALFGCVTRMMTLPDRAPPLAAAMDVLRHHYRAGDTLIAEWSGEVNRVRYYAWRAGISHPRIACVESPSWTGGHRVHVASLSPDEFIERARPDTWPKGRVWHVLSAHQQPRSMFDDREVLFDQTFAGESESGYRMVLHAAR